FGFGKILIQCLLKICNKFFDKANMEISVKKFLLSLIKTILFLILAITICGQLGIETTSFIAVIGSAGLALGLAFQGSLSNFAGGVLILLMKPFKVGDYISESGTGREGTVQQIDICYTTLITPDNKKVVIPNGNLSNSSLTNASAFEKRRVDIEVGVSYSTDISEAKAEMENIANNHALVLKEEEIFSFVSNLDSSQVTLGLRVWCLTSDYWTVKFDLTEGIKQRFDEKGIEIPFNQLVVHLDN
ncbi:MAG: mechanosensitive ion channel family protein, partial [Lachnospiraceae bacterium]|nr:mechanosensitive ion channel family protein [Lachnospiraceae bacterium]